MKEEFELELFVIEKRWGPDDHYLVINFEEQLFREEWKEGDRVRVQVCLEKI